jgi:spermidine synthase
MIPVVVSLFLTGFVSLIGQIVLLRELNVAFFGVELIYLIALGVWLLLTALGTIAVPGRYSPSPDRTATLLLLFALFLSLCVAFLRASRLALGGIPGAYLPFSRQMAALLISLAPVGLLSGLLFRTAAVLYAGKGRTLAGAYGIESAGALVGGLLATLCLRWGIQNFPLAIACGLIAATAALFLFRKGGVLRRRGIAAGLATLMAIFLWQAEPLDRRMTAWSHPGLLDTQDSPYGRITVTTHSGQVSVFTDDALAFETEGTEAELFAHLSALQHAKPQRILVLGGGLDGTVRELLRHRPAQIDMIELDRVLVEMVRSRLPDAIRNSLSDPAVRLLTADPRRFLKERGAAYDLILIGMPEPSSGQANRFYTQEFFRECAARLTPAGVIGLRLPTAENFWTPHLIHRTASIHLALASVFPEVLVLPGTTTVITASRIPLPRSADILNERLRTRAIQTRLVSPPYIRYLFTNDRRFDLEKRLKKTAVPMNTDIRPVCYPYAVMIWLSRFIPKLALTDLPGFGEEANGPGYIWWLIGLCLPLLFLASRLRPAWRRTLLVTVAGFLGIVFEAVLILVYQAREGVLYQDIGLLLMMFMAGLAIGAWLLHEAIRWTGIRHKRTRWWGVGLLAGFGILGIATVGYVTGEFPGGLIPTAALLAAAGFLVAGILAYSSLYGIRDQKQVIAILYAADLLGGCCGSLLGSLVLIPFLGLDGTIIGMILLATFAVLLI